MNTAERLARATLDSLNDRDVERIRDLVTDDFVDHGSPVKLPPGPDAYIAILTFVTEVLQIRYELEDVVASGDMVAVRAVAHGINAVAPQGI
jgi:predicted ester cyclase